MAPRCDIFFFFLTQGYLVLNSLGRKKCEKFWHW